MSNYNNINLKLLSLTLFTAVGLYNINEASANLRETDDEGGLISYIHPVNEKINPINAVNSKPSNSLSDPKEILLVDRNYGGESTLNLDGFEGFDINEGSSKTKTIRVVSLSLFLLLFVPFGIFYPFFLFYKKLLNNNKTHNNLTEETIPLADASGETLPITSFNANSLKLEESTDNIQGVVSKLQIAFVVRDDSLKQKLLELCSSVDSRTDRGIAELMRKTISLLINEDESTHVSHSSASFPVDRIKMEFEAISAAEKSKSTQEKLSVVDTDDTTDDRIQKSSSSSNEDLTRYIVVTLILCTSHTEPLFSEIRTRKQLIEKLSELGKMRQDDLIKFDLLWNPQAEKQYLSNNELLANYMDTIRLF